MTQVALPSPATPEVALILDDVFTLCRVPFVYDFMFTADPVADISILTAPVQNEHAIAARITVSGTEKSASFAHVFDFSCDFFFCSVPAFSVGPITVGFATQEPARDASHAGLHQPATERVQCNRYVRDDERGVFLMLAEHADSGITEVDCMSHRSTRRRTRVCARFHTDTLRLKLRSPRGVLHPDDLAAALTYLNVSYERRACPMCKAADAGECGCVLPFCRPAHPLDFRNERCNMRLHTGLYEGGCTVRLFNASLPFVITSLSTRSVIKGSLDGKVISRLNRYAVQDRMAKLKFNPLATVQYLPAVAGVGCADGAVQERKTGDEVGSSGVDCGLVAEGCEAPASVMLPDESFLQDTGELQSPTLSALSFGALTDGPFPLITAPLGTGTTLIDSVPGRAASDGTEHSCTGSRRDGSPAHSGTGSATQSTTQKTGGEGHSGSQSEGRRGEGKELKAELRKQRNREAAARSNVKRKIRNEALRRDLAEANRRAAELRATEKVLREENVRLRGLATERQFKVSAHLTHIQIARS